MMQLAKKTDEIFTDMNIKKYIKDVLARDIARAYTCLTKIDSEDSIVFKGSEEFLPSNVVCCKDYLIKLGYNGFVSLGLRWYSCFSLEDYSAELKEQFPDSELVERMIFSESLDRCTENIKIYSGRLIINDTIRIGDSFPANIYNNQMLKDYKTANAILNVASMKEIKKRELKTKNRT